MATASCLRGLRQLLVVQPRLRSPAVIAAKNSVYVWCPTAVQPTTAVRMMTTRTSPAQLTDTLMMVMPTHFGFNAVTAVDNVFQKPEEATEVEIRKRAQDEFQALVAKLKSRKLQVHVEKCSNKIASVDAVFPNNVMSFHNEDGKPRIVLYPMMAENRRLERQPDLIAAWARRLGADIVDYSGSEQEGLYLEGTGSMVLDRVNRIAYSCKSQRTHALVLERFCNDLGYQSIVFESSTRTADGGYQAIYHTNVMMSVGDRFALVGFETIRSADERQLVRTALESTGKEVIAISEAQVNEFVGNLLQVCNAEGKKFLVCSTRAFNAMEPHQRTVIQKYCDEILHVPLDTIERVGGGGARCMLCEVFPSVEEK